MKPMIRVENLGKQYRIGRREAPYATLRESITTAAYAPLQRIRRILETGAGLTHAARVRRNGNGGAPTDESIFWALQDINFRVEPGEVVGIVGRNGAGKSTLLKILSRVTEPTTGRVELFGRVGSLLEIGTGFHPELTGRENIYLSGAVLGMRRAEIKKNFDAIVDFAEVERFIDTPVKRFSSGMYMRLAFAVAAHLDTEILLVDEVLAVGDSRFHNKCLGKLADAGGQGRTVLFISHNMPMVTRICGRVILLHEGKAICDDHPAKVIPRYLQPDFGCPAERLWPDMADAPGDNVARLHAVRILNIEGVISEVTDIREPVTIELEYWNLATGRAATLSVRFVNEDGICLFLSNDFVNRTWWHTPRAPGLVRARCTLPGNFLSEGRIYLSAEIHTYDPDHVHARVKDVVSWQIVDHSEGDGVRGNRTSHWEGLIRPMLTWEIDADPATGRSNLIREGR